MAAWNADWSGFFGDERPRPTRTTLSAASLPAPATGVLVEAVAAYLPAGDEPAGETTTHPFNQYIRFAGEGLHGSSAIALVAPGAPLFFSSGTLADVADSAQPEGSVARFGSMETQTASTFRKLERSLAERGFRWEDVFYVRALLSPDPAGGTIDAEGFGSAFEAAFLDRHPRLRPTLAFVAGPGFNATGRLVEIEVYAVAAEPQGPFATHDFSGAANPWVALAGNPESQISSSATVARYRSLTWFSGIVGAAGASMHDQSVAALLTLRSRLSEAGLGPGDAFQLRAYPVVGDSFRSQMDEWNEAYSRFFNHAKLNPSKPARTAFPLVSLPGDNWIEIEVIATGR